MMIDDLDFVSVAVAPAEPATQNSGSRAFARLPLFHSQYAGAARLKPHGARRW
jgi:hypothetical protein